MVKPNKYLEIWPRVVENSIKYLEGKSIDAERRFAFPSAFLTIFYFEDSPIPFSTRENAASKKIEEKFIFLRKYRGLNKVTTTKKIDDQIYRMSSSHFKLYNSSSALESKGTSRGTEYCLNKNGKKLVEGKVNLPPNRKFKHSDKLNINLPESYSKLSNFEEIKNAINALYSASSKWGRSKLEYVLVPKVKI